MMRLAVRQRGFTLLEVLITIVVLALIVAIGVPSMGAAAEKRRIISAAEQIYSQLQLARFTSVARSEAVFANLVEGEDWAMGVSDDAACDPTDNAPACDLPDMDGANAVTRILSANEFNNIVLATTSGQISFSPQRATASAASITVTSTGDIGYVMRVDVGLLGRISICSPADDPALQVAGYRAC